MGAKRVVSEGEEEDDHEDEEEKGVGEGLMAYL